MRTPVDEILSTCKTAWREPATATHTTIHGVVTDEAYPGRHVAVAVECQSDGSTTHTRWRFEVVGPRKLSARSEWSFEDPEHAKYAAQTIALPLLALAAELDERQLFV